MTMIIVFDKTDISIIHVGGQELTLEEISNKVECWLRCNATDGREVTVVAGYPFSRTFADGCARAVEGSDIKEDEVIARLDAALEEYERRQAAPNN